MEVWSVSLYLLYKHVQTETAGSAECIVPGDCAIAAQLTRYLHCWRNSTVTCNCLYHENGPFSYTIVFAGAKEEKKRKENTQGNNSMSKFQFWFRRTF